MPVSTPTSSARKHEVPAANVNTHGVNAGLLGEASKFVPFSVDHAAVVLPMNDPVNFLI